MRILRAKAVMLAMTMMMLLFMSVGPSPRAETDVSFSFFYSNLSPHGSWLASAEYGQVWQPRAYVSDWNPYYDGHWVYTDLGWTWVSDYSWGAIPYHYGTWVLDEDLGWVWVPGYVWAPAWVVFRTGPDYIGWAPVSPRFSVGVSASFGEPDTGSFIFVSAGDFVAPRVRSCVLPERRTEVIFQRTRVVNNLVVENNFVVNRGLDPRVIERASGHEVREVRIEQVRGAAPEQHVNRAKLVVDPDRMRQGLRAAEPVYKGRGSQQSGFDTARPEQDRGRAEDRNPQRERRPVDMNPQRDRRPAEMNPQRGRRPGEMSPQSDRRPADVSPQRERRPSEGMSPRTRPSPPPRESTVSPLQKKGKPAPLKENTVKQGKQPPQKKKDRGSGHGKGES